MNIKACISKHQIGRGETTALGVGWGGDVILGHTW